MHAIHDQVLAWIDDEHLYSFDAIAHAVFTHQFESIEPYRRFCSQRGVTPESVRRWQDIPAIPVQAFKQVQLCCDRPQRIFLSSGTTQGAERRSRHCLPDVRLYRHAALAGLRRFLFPDVDRMRMLALIHPITLLPDSSLAQMVAWAMEELGAEGSAYMIDADGLRYSALIAALHEAERSGQPCCLLTTTAALMRVLDHARNEQLTFRLPHGSRIMDTGGDKGTPRTMSRNGLLHACWSTFAIPGYFCVNEYGMSELSSQYYDSVIADRVHGHHRHRVKQAPHWLRTLVLDPATLTSRAAGDSGLLCHVDVANAGSAVAIVTEDLGRVVDGGLELLGRATGAELRGCSLTLAEWEAGRRS